MDNKGLCVYTHGKLEGETNSSLIFPRDQFERMYSSPLSSVPLKIISVNYKSGSEELQSSNLLMLLQGSNGKEIPYTFSGPGSETVIRHFCGDLDVIDVMNQGNPLGGEIPNIEDLIGKEVEGLFGGEKLEGIAPVFQGFSEGNVTYNSQLKEQKLKKLEDSFVKINQLAQVAAADIYEGVHKQMNVIELIKYHDAIKNSIQKANNLAPLYNKLKGDEEPNPDYESAILTSARILGEVKRETEKKKEQFLIEMCKLEGNLDNMIEGISEAIFSGKNPYTNKDMLYFQNTVDKLRNQTQNFLDQIPENLDEFSKDLGVIHDIYKDKMKKVDLLSRLINQDLSNRAKVN